MLLVELFSLTIEQHLIKEGIPFSKESLDAAHAKYVNELQQADEKAKAEEARKAAENSSSTPKTAVNQETLRLLELTPRMPEIITDMWNASMMRQGWVFVASAIEKKYSVHLGALSREVYQAFKASNGSEEGLQVLIKRYSQRPTAPPTAPPGANQPAIIPPTDPKSSTNQAPQPNTGADIHPDTRADIVPDTVLELFERNRKLSDEQADSFKSKFSC
jgi:hypothetical protein